MGSACIALKRNNESLSCTAKGSKSSIGGEGGGVIWGGKGRRQTLGVNICMQGDADSNSPASWPRRGRAAREGPIAIGGTLDPTLFSPTPHLFLPPFLSFSLSSL